jgi:hypothetical protein
MQEQELTIVECDRFIVLLKSYKRKLQLSQQPAISQPVKKRLLEIRVRQTQKVSSLGEFKLDGTFSYPERDRFINCWLCQKEGALVRLKIASSEGIFPFVDGYCDDFAGFGPAWIVGEIDPSRSMEKDRFVVVQN